jgi:hypothetical protein
MLSIEVGAAGSQSGVVLGGGFKVTGPAAISCDSAALLSQLRWGAGRISTRFTLPLGAYDGATNGHATRASDHHGCPVFRCSCATHTALRPPGGSPGVDVRQGTGDTDCTMGCHPCTRS